MNAKQKETALERYYIDSGGHYSKFEEWRRGLSDYQEQGILFLAETQTEFKAILIGHGPYWDGDKETRDIYEIRLTREGKPPFIFKFGQSIVNSGPSLGESYSLKVGRYTPVPKNCSRLRRAPTPYDVLACLTKYDPETFEDFCGNFGYDSDSRKALATYLAVQEEWRQVQRVFGDVLEKLQEIQ